MKFIYHYNDNKEYTESSIAFLDPLETELKGEDVYLLPPNSTLVEPPLFEENYAIIWNENEWIKVEDYREKEYWPAGSSYYSSPLKMEKVGPLPDGASLTRPEKTEEELDAERLIKAKAERADFVSRIIVEVDDLMFDGDETSQDRMARSIVALNDGETVQWVLADNTIAQVTKEQLREALRKAGTAQTAIWSDPYTK